jgi:plasmid stabilization system protein ParE
MTGAPRCHRVTCLEVMSVFFSVHAEADLEGIANYIAADSPAGALSALPKRLGFATMRIHGNPGRGISVRKPARRRSPAKDANCNRGSLRSANRSYRHRSVRRLGGRVPSQRRAGSRARQAIRTQQNRNQPVRPRNSLPFAGCRYLPASAAGRISRIEALDGGTDGEGRRQGFDEGEGCCLTPEWQVGWPA